MPEIIENFYGDNLYTFTNPTCSCKEDVIYEAPDTEPHRTFKMYPENNTARFAYKAKKGLVRINSNGTAEQENILGAFIGLSTASRNKIERFLNENGFLFPLLPDEYNPIDVDALIAIVKRLKATVDLMTAVGSNKKDYAQIIQLALDLTLSDPIMIQVANTNYTSCQHRLYQLLSLADQISVSRDNAMLEEQGGEFFFAEDTLTDELYKYAIYDYNEIMYDHDNACGDDIEWAITKLFVNYCGSPTERSMIDLIFHYLHDAKSGLVYNERVKSATLAFAKFTIGEEINHHITGIHPEYDAETMEPTWKVDSLMGALYFSLFYLRSKTELYRPCGNPKCSNYFLVKSTSSKTKYCCSRCANNMTQARYRQKKQSEQ
ncbi:CGNR zinc finger domain-containing protein [Ruminococcus sp.]|uniref:CGNR zinc finger domain-containing protein n=1 Tax=Ruminococcus sp. TaxID=41978 RepID=UPI0025DC1FFA|nr:CGNR zinc finger domain-containing protein [Ruminococcus sp.]MCR4637630.1 CGNR zinc finger domain-containing protein [Ruminococcus sp.]